MKKIYSLIAVLVIAATLSVFLHSCKKEKDRHDGVCVIGGVDSQATLLFWVPKDYGGGPYTLKVVEDNGDNITAFNQSPVLSTYESAAPAACDETTSNYNKHAIFSVPYGHKYSYTATSDNRVFKGTVNIPCDDTQGCKSIQIDENYQ